MSVDKQQNVRRKAPALNAQPLALQPARWQLEAMTFMPLGLCGAFSAAFWFAMGGVWGKLLASLIAAFGIWAARAGRRQMRTARVCADAQGVSLFDGSRKGSANQQAMWDDVARCTIEDRSDSADSVGTPHIILKDADGRDLFVLYTKYLSGADTTHLLRFIREELERRNALFDVPARWR